MAAKAIQLAQDIDTARCAENWTLLPDLARRYRKHSSEGILPAIVLAEVELEQLVSAWVRKCGWTPAGYDEDGVGRISLFPRLPLEQVQGVLNKLEHTFGKMVLGRAYYEAGNYSKTREVLSQVSVPTAMANSGYGFVLVIQSKTVKGIALHQTGQADACVEALEGVLTLVGQHPNERNDQVHNWTEQAMYYLALLKGDKHFRSYVNASLQWPPYWRVHRRVVVLRAYAKWAAHAMRHGEYTPPPSVSQANGSGSVIVTPQDGNVDEKSNMTYKMHAFRLEMTQLFTLYEDKLYAITTFPKASVLNRKVLEFTEQLVDMWGLMGGGNTTELRGLIDNLHRATSKTFNSPSIMRHIALLTMQLGDYDEADKAIKAYIKMVGRDGQVREQAQANMEALATIHGKHTPIVWLTDPNEQAAAPGMVQEEDTATLLGLHSQENQEFDQDGNIVEGETHEEVESHRNQVEVFIEGARLFVKHLEDGKRGTELAELAARTWMESPLRNTPKGKNVEASIQRVLGAAYCLLASQTHDKDIRPKYYERALSSLNRSIDLNPTWEGYYQLALQHAEMRDINSAVQAITRSLQINPSHLPSWHLLTLLFSCPVQNNIRQALTTCEIALKQCDWEGVLLDNGQVDPQFVVEGTQEEGEQYLSLYMTRSALLALSKGTEASLSTHESLFSLYAKMFGSENTSGANSVYNDVQTHSNEEVNVGGSHGSIAALRNRNRSGSSLLADGGSVRSADAALGETHHRLGLKERLQRRKTLKKVRKTSIGGYSLQSLQQSQSLSGTLVGGSTGNLADGSVSRGLHTAYASSTSSFTDAQHGPGLTMLGSQKTIFHPTSIPATPSTRQRLRRERSLDILSSLWLASAAAFSSLHRLDEARKAIEEAEQTTGLDPDLWVQLGNLLVEEDNRDEAIVAFHKALALDTYHVPARLQLALLYMHNNETEIAQGLLEDITRGNGWDNAEAWYHLGSIYKDAHRVERAKECLWYALDLEGTMPIRSFGILPRCV